MATSRSLRHARELLMLLLKRSSVPVTSSSTSGMENFSKSKQTKKTDPPHFRPPNVGKLVHVFLDHILADAGVNNLEVWEGEILDQVMSRKSYVRELSLKHWLHF